MAGPLAKIRIGENWYSEGMGVYHMTSSMNRRIEYILAKDGEEYVRLAPVYRWYEDINEPDKRIRREVHQAITVKSTELDELEPEEVVCTACETHLGFGDPYQEHFCNEVCENWHRTDGGGE